MRLRLKAYFIKGVQYSGKKKTPFCTMTEGRTCPLPFSCHSQHTLVFTFSGNSSGSVSSQIQPSQFPSGIVWIYSTLQLCDSAGFSPAYLLSLYQTPDSLIILNYMYYLKFYYVRLYHNLFMKSILLYSKHFQLIIFLQPLAIYILIIYTIN